MPEKEWAPGTLLDVFGDRIARAVLVLANRRSMSVTDLADRLDVSDQTVYRRVDELVESDLLKEHQRADQDGNQYKEYETIVEEVTFAMESDGYTVDVQFSQDLTDDFDSMWADLEATSTDSETSSSSRPDGTGADPI